MKTNHKILSLRKLFALLLLPLLAMACDKDDNGGGDVRDSLRLTASADEITLNEDTPNDVALTFDWTAATEVGSDYYLSYIFKMDMQDNFFQNPVREYEDEGPGTKTYTHRALQNLLINKWGCTPGTTVLMEARIIGTLEGPRFVKPEVSTISFKIKTYAPRPFLADVLYLGGTAAVGLEAVKINPMLSDPKQFVWIGELQAGTLNFPIEWSDEVRENAIAPLVAEQDIVAGPMDAQIKSVAYAGVWNIPQAGRYRVAVNLTTQTVTIGLASNHIEADRILMAGGAVTSEGAQLTRTLESDKIFAFHGPLKAGTINFPIEFNGVADQAITPKTEGEQPISDGQPVDLEPRENSIANCWTIPSAGVYRIVVNIGTNKVTIYSPSTDPQPYKLPTFTYSGQNPDFTQPYAPDRLWMYGGFNGWNVGTVDVDPKKDPGFSFDYVLLPSLANPNLFVYSGAALPRKTDADKYKLSVTGAMMFFGYPLNNAYGFGSTAPAKRNEYNGYENAALGVSKTLVPGQADNRYAYFNIPEGTNYIAVDVQNLTVVFEKR